MAAEADAGAEERPSGDEAAAGEALLREGMQAYSRGDLGWIFGLAAEDIEVHTADGLVNSGSFTGKERLWIWLSEWQEAWSEMTVEIVNVTSIGGRFLLAEVVQRGVGALSGIKTTMELVQLVEVRGQEVVRFHLYPDLDRARAAAAELR